MTTRVKLNNGISIPAIGLGTWQIMDKDAIKTAVDAGYRHFDTAALYDNEEVVGEAIADCIRAGKVKRSDLYIVTKLCMRDMGKDSVKPASYESLRRLQLEYIDLYLIHNPMGSKKHGQLDELEQYDLVETWTEMEQLVDSGKVRSIGVSNFNSVQLDNICKNARILPVTNQVEAHPYLPQVKLMEKCNQLGIILTAYSPIGTPGISDYFRNEREMPILLEDKKLCQLAHKYNKSPAQVSIRYLIQRGFVVIPKSCNAQRQRENLDVFVFTLDEEDLDMISKITVRYRYFLLGKLSEHPDYPFKIPY